jgi:hypothetical protein
VLGLPTYNLAEGKSLTPFLQNPDAASSRPALSFYGKGNVAVRDERYRLTQYEDGSIEFYDMENDPNEWNNPGKRRKSGRTK